MTVLDDIPATHAPGAARVRQYQSHMLSPVSTQPASAPGSKRTSTYSLGRDSRRMSQNITALPMMLLPTPSSSPTLKGKKTRPQSLSSLLLQHEQQQEQQEQQQQGNVQSRLSRQSKASWRGNRGGVGMNEMMVDLETTGVFVPSSGQRLRAEFVYRTVIQCADEIRRRGLDHPNIFYNPSPKKVISSMIALLTDQDRCDLYPIQCLRIDTVTGLLLNLLSQMSNPVVPYLVMEHYFRRGGSATRSPSMSTIHTSSRRQSSTIATTPMATPERTATLSDSSPISSLLPAIPALPPRGPSYVEMNWAREHFDLPAFLDVLPAMNRVILLEVLHLCQEILDRQGLNRMTLTRLVNQVSPALFSTVFDQKILETMAGGSMQCSIHGDGISSEEGSRAENYLFMVILVRFLFLTSSNDPNAATNSNMYNDMYNTCDNNYGTNNGNSIHSHPIETNGSSVPTIVTPVSESIYGQSNNSTSFRKSQERLLQEQQEYHDRMERSYQEMEIRKRPSQHFGVYSAAQKQQLQQEQQQYLTPARSNDQIQDKIVPDLAVSKHDATHVDTALTIGDGAMGAILAITEASMMDKRAHYDHLCQVRA
ncbi:hypothetical protein BGZ58_008005 [Dissophora ornata]|nr:hypothetical protein BGZ58_008005 [Dissophora ornata]